MMIKQAQQIESIALDYYNYQVLLADRVIAYITHDPSDFATQSWVIEINEEEVHRATTVAKCENWVKWHYKQGTLPIHDEWLTAQEEFLDRIEEITSAIAPEPTEISATEVKVARQLEVGDKIVLNGEIWKLERINIQPVQYQSWHSDVHGVRFHLTLLPNSYQYQPYPTQVGQEINWNDAGDHEFREAERFATTAMYLSPYGEAEFDVVMKAVLLKPEMTPMTTVGYDFCLANNIQFRQRTGESGTFCWYGVALTYYGQPGRQYRTIGFPDLKKTIKAALDYLVKCNAASSALVKQQMVEEVIASAVSDEQFVMHMGTTTPNEQSNKVATEPSRFINTVKQLAPVTFALILTIGIAGNAIAARKKVIQPPKNPNALFSIVSDY